MEVDGQQEEVPEEERLVAEALQALRQELQDNPLSYQAHVKLVYALMAGHDFPGVEKALEEMNTWFPLSKNLWDMWLQAAQAPLEVDPDDEDAQQHLLDIHRRSLQDLYSAELWVEYAKRVAQFQSENEDGDLGLCRATFEEAVQACCFDVRHGHLVWLAYAEFEEDHSPEDMQAGSESYRQVRSVFLRALSYPYLEHEAILEAYEAWEMEESAFVEVKGGEEYQRALHQLSRYSKSESKLERKNPNDTIPVETWISHALTVKKTLKSLPSCSTEEVDSVMCLCERSLQDSLQGGTIPEDLWIFYLDYVMQRGGPAQYIVPSGVTEDCSLFRRAVRCSPSCPQLWIYYALFMERMGIPCDSMHVIFRKALASVDRQNSAMVVDLCLAWCDYCLRQYRFAMCAAEDAEKLTEQWKLQLREVFQECDTLVLSLPRQDPQCRVLCFQARVEAFFFGELPTSVELMEIAVQRNPKSCDIWTQFFELHRQANQLSDCRQILERASKSVSSVEDARRIQDKWLQFEREYANDFNSSSCLLMGSLFHLSRSLRVTFGKIKDKIRSKVKSFGDRRKHREQVSSKHESPAMARNRADKSGARGGDRHPKGVVGTAGQKRTRVEVKESNKQPRGENAAAPDPSEALASSAGSPAKKRSKSGEGGQDLAEVQEQQDTGERAQIQGKPVQDMEGVEPAGKTDAPSSTKSDQKKAAGKKKAPLVEGPAAVDNVQRNVAFVWNLHFHTTEDQLRAFFEEMGNFEIKDIRLQRESSGKSKGYAYVEMASEEMVQAAIEENEKHVLLGRKIRIRESRVDVVPKKLKSKRGKKGSDGAHPGRRPGLGFEFGAGPVRPSLAGQRNVFAKRARGGHLQLLTRSDSKKSSDSSTSSSSQAEVVVKPGASNAQFAALFK